MSKIEDIRESIDSKLDQWEQVALAIEAQLQSTKEQALNRLETQKKKMAAAAARIQQSVQRSTRIREQARGEIKEAIDHLQVQLALGKADALDAYQEQQKKIMDGIASIEARIARHEAELNREWEAAVQEWIREEGALEAELEAAQVQFQSHKAQRRAEFDAKRKQIADQVNAYREQIADKRRLASNKLATFEDELCVGVGQIKQTFSTLWSS